MPPKAGLDAELHLKLTSWVLIPRLLENFNRTLFNKNENTIEVRKYPKYIANNNDGCSMEIFVSMKV